MIRKANILGIVLVIALATARGPAMGAETVTLGGIGPLTAPGAYQAGQEMMWAMRLAVEEMNAGGGVLGKEVKFVFADSQGLPEQATAAMERLITKDEVVGVAGEYHSSAALPESKLAHNHHIPFVVAEAWSDQITANGFPEVFRIAPANSMVYSLAGNWIEAVKFKRIAIFAETTDWGLDVAKVLSKKAEDSNIRCDVITTDREAMDFTSQLLRIKNMKPRPELLVGIVTGPASFRLTKQAKQIGLCPTAQTAHYSGASDTLYPEFWENVGENGLYEMASPVGLPKSKYAEETEKFIAAFTEKYKRAPTTVAMEGYDGIWLLAKAIEAAGSTDASKMIKALETFEWNGTRGKYYFPTKKDPAYMYHQWPDVPMYIFQYTKVGQAPEDAPILWPRRWASTDKLLLKPNK
jgi:branched-chain amino acid transport system substrate-binding protein